MSLLLLATVFGKFSQIALAQSDLLNHTQPDTSKTIGSIVVASCFSQGETLDEAFDRIASLDPDLFLWLGDNI